jgi:hypothetical protein
VDEHSEDGRVPLARGHAHDIVRGEDEEHERRKSAKAVSVYGRLRTEDEDGPDAGHDQRDCNGDALVIEAHFCRDEHESGGRRNMLDDEGAAENEACDARAAVQREHWDMHGEPSACL